MSQTEKPLLVMFLGLPGSGKTYFARRLAERIQAIRLNGDTMRIAMFGSLEAIEKVYYSEDRSRLNEYVFGAIDYAVEQILQSGTSVVYDAHHNMRLTRLGLEELAEKCGARALVVRVQTPYDIALKRGQERTASADQRQLSEEKMREAMDRHHQNTDEPAETETIIEIDGQQPFDEQFESFQNQLKLSMKDAK